MAFIPNEAQAGIYPRLGTPFSSDFDELVATFLNNAIVEGCAITAGTGLSVSMAAGTRLAAGRFAVVAALSNQALTTADATNPRIDTIVLNASGTFTIRAGTPAALPVPVVYTAGDTVLAFVYVPATATTLTTVDNIVDKRVIRDPRGTIYNAGAQTAITTAVTNQNAFPGVTIPANYPKAGDHIRIRAWFVETTVASPGNLTLRVKLGTTVLATTGAVARTASLTTKLILLECDLFVVDTTHIEAQGAVDYNTSATASARWTLGATAGNANNATIVIGTTAQVLTIDATTTVATATLTPRTMSVEMF